MVTPEKMQQLLEDQLAYFIEQEKTTGESWQASIEATIGVLKKNHPNAKIPEWTPDPSLTKVTVNTTPAPLDKLEKLLAEYIELEKTTGEDCQAAIRATQSYIDKYYPKGAP